MAGDPTARSARVIRALARLFAGCTIGLLAGCSGASTTPSRPAALPSTSSALIDPAPQCRVSANGGPVGSTRVADRGIGGTGAPDRSRARQATGSDRSSTDKPDMIRVADRGIGGTGISATPPVDAARGSLSGTTTIVAVITGFGSVCLGGQEVAVDPSVPVLINGRAAQTSDLRAGQVAVVAAGPVTVPLPLGLQSEPPSLLQAQHVVVRHAVSGPVEAIETGPDGTVLRVAGQRIALSSTTLGDTTPRLGSWLAVSGFGDPDGLIHATRLDARPPGSVIVSGRLVRDTGRWRVGAAEIHFPPGIAAQPDTEVVLLGHYADGILTVDAVDPDRLGQTPRAYFGGSSVLIVESYAGLVDGRLLLGRTERRGDALFRDAVVMLGRRSDGALIPFANPGRPTGGSDRGEGQGAGRTAGSSANRLPGTAPRNYEPAPMPNRTGYAGAFGDRQDGRPGSSTRGGRGADAALPERTPDGHGGGRPFRGEPEGSAPSGPGFNGPGPGGGVNGAVSGPRSR